MSAKKPTEDLSAEPVLVRLTPGMDSRMIPEFSEDGKELIGVVIVPLFNKPSAVPNIVYARTLGPMPDRAVKSQVVLKLSGRTAQLSLVNRDEKVMPQFLAGPEASTDAAAAEDGD